MNSEIRNSLIDKILENISDEPLAATINTHLETILTTDDIHFHKERDFILKELDGWGPLESLIADSQVSEILINSFKEIYYEKSGSLQSWNMGFSSAVTLNRLVKKILDQIDRVADQRHPLVDGTLNDGTRVHIALPPVTQSPTLSFRRHNHRTWSLNDLCEQKMFSQNIKNKLSEEITKRKTILISGPTGSGKTTLLRALLNDVPSQERIVTIEDTQELKLTKPNSVSLLTRISLDGLVPSITLNDLLKNALRMRPDRLVIGEMRSEEALIFLDAVSTGHAGSMSSIHGSSPEQALSRLEHLVSRAAPQWSIQSIRKLIFESVNTVICVERQEEGRRISKIADLTGLENFGFLTEPWSLH